jgi:hypothetical protein
MHVFMVFLAGEKRVHKCIPCFVFFLLFRNGLRLDLLLCILDIRVYDERKAKIV